MQVYISSFSKLDLENKIINIKFVLNIVATVILIALLLTIRDITSKDPAHTFLQAQNAEEANL
jgi:hypothetical protein